MSEPKTPPGILETPEPVAEIPHQAQKPKRNNPKETNKPRNNSVQDNPVSGTGDDDDTYPEWGSRVAAIGDEISQAGRRGAKKKTTATDQDWEEFLTVCAGFGSMLFAWWLATGTGIPKSERDTLELTEDEASAVARPLSRIFERSWINRSYGKHVLGGSDYITLAIAIVIYVERVGPYVRRKMATAIPRRKPTGVSNNGNQPPVVEEQTTNPATGIPYNLYGNQFT